MSDCHVLPLRKSMEVNNSFAAQYDVTVCHVSFAGTSLNVDLRCPYKKVAEATW